MYQISIISIIRSIVSLYPNTELRKYMEMIFKTEEKLSNYMNSIQTFHISVGKRKNISPTGNWTPVSRVTGGDTYHYTIEDI